MSAAVLRAPFPYFGGKRRAASLVWEALGNVDHYVEPFAGSAAVLLARPHVGRCETINDLDGMVSNFWRAVRSQPDAVADACDWPVIEADLHARHLWLIGQRESLTARLIADPEWCDPKIAGWWAWGACAWIGSGWCASGTPSQQLPCLAGPGGGLHSPTLGPAIEEPDGVRYGSVADWLRDLQRRMSKVRVASGDWSRITSRSVLFFSGYPKTATTGVFLDPPYAEGAQQYAAGGTGTGLSAEVRAWCASNSANKSLRVVLAGYDGEHGGLEALGWRAVEWKTKGGYAVGAGGNPNQKRERLWLSPACLDATRQRSLFAGGA